VTFGFAAHLRHGSIISSCSSVTYTFIPGRERHGLFQDTFLQHKLKRISITYISNVRQCVNRGCSNYYMLYMGKLMYKRTT
jgi:hypothetical protein